MIKWFLPICLAVVLATACQSPDSEELADPDELVIRDSVVCYSLMGKPLKHVPETVKSYNRKDSLLKTLEFSDYREYGGYWRAHQFRMENHQTGKKTVLNWQDYKLGVGLNERDFNQNALKRLM